METVLRQAGELPESPWLHLHATEAAALQALREQTAPAPQDPAAAVL